MSRMCGIGGIYLNKNAPFNFADLQKMWHKLEDRGQDAAGISFLWKNADQPTIIKSKGSASKLSPRVKTSMGSMIQYAMLHTRYTTQGSVENNNNNHPVLRSNIILTHNGVIYNDWELFLKLNRIPMYEVDTESIACALANESIDWVAENAEGSMSLAWVDIYNKETVNLFTNGRNPLVIAELPCGSIVWASGIRHLEHYNYTRFFHAIPGVLYSITPKGIRQTVITDKFGLPMTKVSRRVY